MAVGWEEIVPRIVTEAGLQKKEKLPQFETELVKSIA
jgi:hypothetical protein